MTISDAEVMYSEPAYTPNHDARVALHSAGLHDEAFSLSTVERFTRYRMDASPNAVSVLEYHELYETARLFEER